MMRRHEDILAAFAGLKERARADYAAARPGRFTRTRRGLGGVADAHYASETDYIRVREYVRDMYRNDGLSAVKRIVDCSVNNMVRAGPTPEPNTGDEKLNVDLWQSWQDWAADPDQCDVAGEHDFAQLVRLAKTGELVDGDIFYVATETGALQAMESDRCRTPGNSRRRIVHGIELSPLRQKIACYFTKATIDPFVRFDRVGDAERIPVRDADGRRQIFQLYDPSRVTQSRGITAFHAVCDVAGMLEDVNFALIVKQQLAAALGLFLETDVNAKLRDVQFGDRVADSTVSDDSNVNQLESLAPGLIIRGKPGQKATVLSPNLPSAETLEHVKYLLMMISANLGLPLMVVLLDPRENNFSGWRAAMDQAKIGFQWGQQNVERRLLRPAWQWRIRWHMAQSGPSGQALRNAADRLGPALFRHTWTHPHWPYIQPLHDAQAAALRLQTLQTSLRRLHAENGQDYDDVVRETVLDNSRAIRLAIKAAQKMKAKLGVDVDWRELLNRELARGIKPVEATNASDA